MPARSKAAMLPEWGGRRAKTQIDAHLRGKTTSLCVFAPEIA